jgi:hypothetical protein
VVALCVVMLAGGSTARAQSDSKNFVGFNLGLQPQSQTFTATTAPVINGENASITVPQTIGSAPFFDVSGGHFWGRVGLGAGFSRFSDTEPATITARIPNPIVFGSLRTATATTSALAHTESAIHALLLWKMPLSDTVDVVAFVGPSVLTVKQGLVSGVTTNEGLPPFTSVTIASVQTEEASKTDVALNVGADVTVRVTRQIGVGGFARYLRVSGGNVDLSAAAGQSTVSVPAGGFQVGGGLRVSF